MKTSEQTIYVEISKEDLLECHDWYRNDTSRPIDLSGMDYGENHNYDNISISFLKKEITIIKEADVKTVDIDADIPLLTDSRFKRSKYVYLILNMDDESLATLKQIRKDKIVIKAMNVLAKMAEMERLHEETMKELEKKLTKRKLKKILAKYN